MKWSTAVKSMTKTVAISAVLIAMFLGCASRSRVVVHRPHAKVVVVKKNHVHSKRCGHYRYRGKWYYLKGHHHGPRCGHLFVRGIWIIK